jgi:hypothetical protein
VQRLDVDWGFPCLCFVEEQLEDGRTVLVEGLEERDPTLEVHQSHTCQEHAHLAKHQHVRVVLAVEYLVQSVEHVHVRSHLVLLQPGQTLEDGHLVRFD